MTPASQSSKHCTFVADVGFVCPPTFPLSECGAVQQQVVTPYLDCTLDVRRAVAQHLVETWHAETGGVVGSTPQEATAFIEKHWSTADVMYVLTVGGAYVGAVVVDRKNMVPCVSHLMVKPEHRGQGFGQALMECAEAYVTRCLAFSVVKLWCRDALVPFYERQGYRRAEQNKGCDAVKNTIVMEKRLEPHQNADGLDDGLEAYEFGGGGAGAAAAAF